MAMELETTAKVPVEQDVQETAEAIRSRMAKKRLDAV